MDRPNGEKAETNDDYRQFPESETPDCRELEDEFAVFFEYLNSISDVENQTLEATLDSAIDEEEKFAAWRQSRRPLENLRFFHKNGGRRMRVDQPSKLSDLSRSIEVTVDLELNDVSEKSQFEIWECDGRDEPAFRLHHLYVSEILQNGKLKVREDLRKDIRLQIEAEISGNHISYKLSREFSFYAAAAGSLRSFVKNEREIVRQILKFGWLKQAFALANFIYVIVFLVAFVIQPATAMNVAGRTHSEEEIIREKCEKEICVAEIHE